MIEPQRLSKKARGTGNEATKKQGGINVRYKFS
jgi:hypothetical protein